MEPVGAATVEPCGGIRAEPLQQGAPRVNVASRVDRHGNGRGLLVVIAVISLFWVHRVCAHELRRVAVVIRGAVSYTRGSSTIVPLQDPMGGEPPLCAVVLAQTCTHRVRYVLRLPITPAIGEDAKNIHPLAVDWVCVELHLVHLGGRQPVGNQAVAKVGARGGVGRRLGRPAWRGRAAERRWDRGVFCHKLGQSLVLDHAAQSTRRIDHRRGRRMQHVGRWQQSSERPLTAKAARDAARGGQSDGWGKAHQDGREAAGARSGERLKRLETRRRVIEEALRRATSICEARVQCMRNRRKELLPVEAHLHHRIARQLRWRRHAVQCVAGCAQCGNGQRTVEEACGPSVGPHGGRGAGIQTGHGHTEQCRTVRRARRRCDAMDELRRRIVPVKGPRVRPILLPIDTHPYVPL